MGGRRRRSRWRSSSRRFAGRGEKKRSRRREILAEVFCAANGGLLASVLPRIADFPFFFPSFSSSFILEPELSISTYPGLWVFCTLGFVFIEIFFSFFWFFFFGFSEESLKHKNISISNGHIVENQFFCCSPTTIL